MITTDFQVPGAVVPPNSRFSNPRATSGENAFFYNSPAHAGGAQNSGEVTASAALAFSDVVDEDQGPAYTRYVRDEIVVPLVESVPFRLSILGVIVLNSVTIGLQTDPDIQRTLGSALKYLDTIFLALYCFEIWLKWYGNFAAFWFDLWNLFDLIIVSATLLGTSVAFISSARVLRILRVVRAFRSQHSAAAFQGLQIIVQTLVRSAPTIMNVLILTFVVMFIFSCIGVSAFATHSPFYFGTMDRALFTMYIYLTQDGWVDPFEQLEKSMGMLWPALFSVSFIVVGAWVMIEIIVGVTVNILVAAHEAAKREERNASRRMARSAVRHVDSGSKSKTAAMAAAGGGATSFGGAESFGGASSLGDSTAGDTALGGGGGGGGAAGAPTASAFSDKTVPSWTLPYTVWEAQHAWETPVPRISAPAVEAYLLVLSALEDNFSEFALIRESLEQTYRRVRRANDFGDGAESDSVPQSLSTDDSTTSSDDSDDHADALTQLIRRERQGRSVALAQARIRQARTRRLVVRLRDAASEDHAKSTRAVSWALGDLASSAPTEEYRSRRRDSFQGMFEACGVKRSSLLDQAERMMSPEARAVTRDVAGGGQIASLDAAASVLALGIAEVVPGAGLVGLPGDSSDYSDSLPSEGPQAEPPQDLAQADWQPGAMYELAPGDGPVDF